jgi:ribonuclease BN (tRNA processing enzyme)
MRSTNAIVLTLLGTGGGTPYDQHANSSAVTRTEEVTVLYDAGSGVCMRLAQAGIARSDIDIICLSHLHADHCLELPLLVLSAFLEGRNSPITIFGPNGVNRHIEVVFGELFGYITDLVASAAGSRPKLEVRELESGVAAEKRAWKLSCAPVQHTVPALAYRFETPAGSVAISGDTEYCESMVNLAKSASVLVHECPFPVEMDTVPGHTTASEVGQVAARAGVGAVILTHLFVETLGKEAEMIDAVQRAFRGKAVIGTDLLTFRIAE